jgi:hypothetical protein
MDGKWGKVNRNTAERDSSKISAEFELGARQFKATPDNGLQSNGRFGWYGSAKLIYGTPYQNYKTPFSNIYVQAEMGKDDSALVNGLRVYGSLMGWEIRPGHRTQHLLVLSANYDFIRNEAFFYGGQSIKLNLFSQLELPKGLKFNSNFAVGPVLLAAIPDNYMYKDRNYDYASGITATAGGGLNVRDKFFASLTYTGGWLSTINGNRSNYFLHTVAGEFRYMLRDNLAVVAAPGYFTLEGNYRDHPNVDKKYPFVRATLRYCMDFK